MAESYIPYNRMAMPNIFQAVAKPAPMSRNYRRALSEIDREQRELVAPSANLGPRGVPTGKNVFHRDEQEAKVRRIIKRMRQGDRNSPRDLKRALASLGLNDANSFRLSNAERSNLVSEIQRRQARTTKHKSKGHRRR